MNHHGNRVACDSTRPYLCTLQLCLGAMHYRIKRVFYAWCSGKRPQVARGEELESPLCCFLGDGAGEVSHNIRCKSLISVCIIDAILAITVSCFWKDLPKCCECPGLD